MLILFSWLSFVYKCITCQGLMEVYLCTHNLHRPFKKNSHRREIGLYNLQNIDNVSFFSFEHERVAPGAMIQLIEKNETTFQAMRNCSTPPPNSPSPVFERQKLLLI